MSRLPLVLGLLAVALPPAARAQVGAPPRLTVAGIVLDEATGLGIPSASVELDGRGVVVTDADGAFRFTDVPAGRYTLWVFAFGYAARSRQLSLRGDLSFTMSVEPAPVPLEGVAATFVEVKGRVRDPANDFFLVDAVVLTNQARGAATDAHGRFELEGMLEGAPLRLTIESFGYVTVDTVVVPNGDDEYVFDLHPDPVVEALIEVQVQRLEKRAAPAFAPLLRNMNRDRIVRFAGAHTVRSMLESEYWNWRHRIGTVYVDGLRWSLTKTPLEELFALLPEQIQRIEFIMIPGVCARVDIYTREFMRELIARADELPPVCDSLREDPWATPGRAPFGGFQ